MQPDFVDGAETKHPGIAAEYCALTALVRPLFKHSESDEFRHTAMLQSGIAWQHYNAILLLLSHGFGIQGLVLCRTLFEVVVGTLYLIKNPSLLADFTDHGKLLLYERCLAGGLSAQELTKIAPEPWRILLAYHRDTPMLDRMTDVATFESSGFIFCKNNSSVSQEGWVDSSHDERALECRRWRHSGYGRADRESASLGIRAAERLGSSDGAEGKIGPAVSCLNSVSQYSSGSRTVVTPRSASVMIQILVPLLSA